MKTEKSDKPDKSEKSTVKVTVGSKASSSDNSKSASGASNGRPAKVFDVMRPGRAPASPSSRPVVMGHKAQAEASQVSVSGIGEATPRSLMDSHKKASISSGVASGNPGSPDMESSSGDTPSTAQWSSSTHKTITPLSESKISKDRDAAPGAPALPGDQAEKLTDLDDPGPINLNDPASPKASGDLNPKTTEDLGLQEDEAKLDEVAAEPEPAAPAPEPEPAQPVAPVQDIAPSPAAAVDTPATDQPASNPAAANAPSASTAQAEHLLQDLTPEDMEEEHIVISHHAVHGVWKAVLAVVIILVLAAVIVDILFDAGIIDSMGIPHTDFL
jgi:hypothetical protein